MKVFISWSGQRSEELAKALHEWITLVLHYTKPWLSKSDIQAGDRWSSEISKELEECNFGILCITKENLHSDWILFEAGALAKSMQDGRVVPLLLDVDFREISGPLAQFQSKKVELSGMKDLVVSLNKGSQDPIPDDRLNTLFDLAWSRLEKRIGLIPAPNTPKRQERTQGEILEELVSSIRGVEMRIRDSLEDDLPRRGRRGSRRDAVLFDLIERIPTGTPTRLLALAGIIKQDAPWIYDFALEATKRPRSQSGDYITRLVESVEFLRHGSFVDNPITDRVVHELLQESHLLLEHMANAIDLSDRADVRPRRVVPNLKRD